MGSIEKKVSKWVYNTISNSSVTMFRNMTPVIKTKQSDIAKYNNFILYSTFSVEVRCDLEFPIKFLGKKTPTMVSLKSRCEIAVDDSAEFIRNTDMVIDYFEGSSVGQSIKSAFDKINDFISAFAGS